MCFIINIICFVCLWIWISPFNMFMKDLSPPFMCFKSLLFYSMVITLFLHRSIPKCDEKELEVLKDIKIQIIEKENVFFEMESYLPKKNG